MNGFSYGMNGISCRVSDKPKSAAYFALRYKLQCVVCTQHIGNRSVCTYSLSVLYYMNKCTAVLSA